VLLEQSHGTVSIEHSVTGIKTNSLSVVINGFIILTLPEALIALPSHSKYTTHAITMLMIVDYIKKTCV